MSDLTTGLVIFARMDSHRLPGKVLRSIVGRPLLGRIIDRAQLVKSPSMVVIATSDRKVDDPIAKFGASEGVYVFRGPYEDVAARAAQCARAWGFDRFVRICGDSPFIDPQLIDVLLGKQSNTGADLVTNVNVRTYPAGASVEVVRTEALERLIGETDDPNDREHVTRYFYRHPERFRIVSHELAATPPEGVRLVVDTAEDYARAEWITARLGDRPELADFDAIMLLAHEAHNTLA